MGAVGTILQSAEVVGIKVKLPTVKGLPADAETAAGQGGVATVGGVVAHPAKPLLGSPAQLVPRARQLVRSGNLSASDLHGDTLPKSVTHHSERTQEGTRVNAK